MELSWQIETITEADYDEVNETVKQVKALLDGSVIPHLFIRDSTETDADSKTAIKTTLTDRGYTWDTEI